MIYSYRKLQDGSIIVLQQCGFTFIICLLNTFKYILGTVWPILCCATKPTETKITKPNIPAHALSSFRKYLYQYICSYVIYGYSSTGSHRQCTLKKCHYNWAIWLVLSWQCNAVWFLGLNKTIAIAVCHTSHILQTPG